MESLGDAIGTMVRLLFTIAAFGAFAAVSSIGIALWSIWLPITVPQALTIMGVFGVSGAVMARMVLK